MSLSKTEAIMFDNGESCRERHVMQLGDGEMYEVERFKYLGLVA